LYEDARNREQGRSEVLVTSAFELEAKQIQMLTGALAKRLGREVQMSVEVDPELIGGVVIRAGDVVIDASVKGKLRELANHML
jgi:F-type H+-transporting ATPase subunit delta